MARPPASFETEELLAQLGWVRALARRVAPDAHVAEDLTQEAMVVALRGETSSASASIPAGEASSPDDARPASLRRWLGAVVRNLGRTRRRSDRRRAEREARAAERELPPSTLELIERAATQRELVGALLELDEPYRSTLLLRFFEECSQREIAERTGVPVSTVGTRIAEGLKRLRRRFGGRNRWSSSVLAYFRRPRDLVRPTLIHGALLVTVKTKLILGGAVLVGALFVFRGLDQGTPGPSGPEPPVPSPRNDVASAGVPVEAGREAVETEEPVEARTPDFHDIPEHAGIAHSTVRVRGRVIDLDERPVGGVEVCRVRPRGWNEGTGELVPAQNLGCVTADGAGRFETEGVPPFRLSVRDDHYTTLFEGLAPWGPEEPEEDPADEILVVVAPRIPLGGLVIDEGGAPVGGARITVQATVSRPGLDLSGSSLVVPEALSDERGAFEIEGAAGIEEARIQFQAPGFVTRILPVPAGGDGALVVVMSRASESLYTIQGHVVLADGSPAVGAYVSTGVMASRTDDQGFFVIDLEPWLEVRVDEEAPTVVTAVLPGLLPASLTLPSVKEARESGWPAEIVLELVGAPLTIRGIVVDEEGEPVSRVLVEPADTTAFGLVPAEDMPAYFGVLKTLEELAGGGATYTGEDGRFELGGLLDRSYSICALQEPSLLCVVSDPVEAGDRNVRIVLDDGGLGTIQGRIVDRHGEGIGGVRVAVSRKRVAELVIGASALTDRDGSFTIAGVTTEPEFLRIEGDAIVPELFRELDEEDDLTALELRVGRRCRVQFDWGDWPGRRDELRVVDERDRPLMMMRLRGNAIGEVPSVAFQRSVTDVLVVSDEAVHAVVYRDGVELTRIRLNLTADELNLIRL